MNNDTVLGLLLIALALSLGRSAGRARASATERAENATGAIGAMALALYELDGGASAGPMILFWIGIVLTVSGTAISVIDVIWKLVRRVTAGPHHSRAP